MQNLGYKLGCCLFHYPVNDQAIAPVTLVASPGIYRGDFRKMFAVCYCYLFLWAGSILNQSKHIGVQIYLLSSEHICPNYFDDLQRQRTYFTHDHE